MVDLDEHPKKIYPTLPRDQPNPSAPSTELTNLLGHGYRLKKISEIQQV